jgi:hypothetical protein
MVGTGSDDSVCECDRVFFHYTIFFLLCFIFFFFAGRKHRKPPVFPYRVAPKSLQVHAARRRQNNTIDAWVKQRKSMWVILLWSRAVCRCMCMCACRRDRGRTSGAWEGARTTWIMATETTAPRSFCQIRFLCRPRGLDDNVRTHMHILYIHWYTLTYANTQ